MNKTKRAMYPFEIDEWVRWPRNFTGQVKYYTHAGKYVHVKTDGGLVRVPVVQCRPAYDEEGNAL